MLSVLTFCCKFRTPHIVFRSTINCKIITHTTANCAQSFSMDGDGSGTEIEGDAVNGICSPMEEFGKRADNWRGASMDEIHRHLNIFELEHVRAVHANNDHTVLYRHPIKVADDRPPQPFKAHPKWDSTHVRLPSSVESKYPVESLDGTAAIESRWEMIEKALLRPIANSHELQAAIISYNSRYADQWDFRALHRLFESELDESESRVFFEDLLPRIVRLALRLPELVQAPIPLLTQGRNRSLSLSQEQISCLLANAFLCTFPRRNTLKRKSEYSRFPDINFNRLFQSTGSSVLEKIKCICHYFRRVCPTERDSLNVPTGVVTFARRSCQSADLPNWDECRAPLDSTMLHITSEGTIEDQGLGLLQVDFANKYLGGGVLGCGCVQEEIRFVICPELLVSKLFTECLLPTEALLMVGCERYSNYSGYSNTFEWAGNHEDSTPRDSSRRILTHVVAIDALAFKQSTHQYQEDLMLRELNKAYAGFFHDLPSMAPGVASGNWGCGAFRGDARLKALLQLLVCAAVKRPLVYYTFGDETLRDDVHKLHKFLSAEKFTVNEVWATLKQFKDRKLPASQLYSYICDCQRKHSLKANRWKKLTEHDANAASGSCNQGPSSSTETLRKRCLSENSIDDSAENRCSEPLNSPSPEADSPLENDRTNIPITLPAEKRAPGVQVAQTGNMDTKLLTSPKMRQCTLLEMLDKSQNSDNRRGQTSSKMNPKKRVCAQPAQLATP